MLDLWVKKGFVEIVEFEGFCESGVVVPFAVNGFLVWGSGSAYVGEDGGVEFSGVVLADRSDLEYDAVI